MTPNGSISRQTLILFLVFSCVQFYVVFAGSGATPSSATTMPPQAIMGRLTTSDNQFIAVNGNSATTGATIMPGARMETGAVGATINFGSLGTIDLPPNAQVQIGFSDGQVVSVSTSGVKQSVTGAAAGSKAQPVMVQAATRGRNPSPVKP